MKLTPRTIQILKNFTSLNSSIYIDPGNVIRTMTETKTVIAHATVPEMFPRSFGIYDLNQFLGVASLFTDPDLEFDTQYLNIKGADRSSSRYYYSSKEMHVPVPQNIKMPEPLATFTLSEKVLKQILQATNVMNLPEVVIQCDGSELKVVSTNTKNNTSNSFLYDIGNCNKRFKAIIKIDNLRLLSGTYEVKITDRGITEFALPGGSLKYWIATEASSSYGE
jgi:hypothetical protein